MAAATAAAGAAPAPKGKKKLLLIIVAATLLLLVAGGGGAAYLMKKRAAEAAALDAEGDEPAEHAPAKGASAHKAAPTFVPLDAFTVNLADREAERYAQIGITLELEDAKDAETVKQYMPAIRNNILMVLAHKQSSELLEREGKTKLADEIRRETLRALGVETPAEDPAADGAKPKKAKKGPPSPVRAVQFSNFIIQ